MKNSVRWSLVVSKNVDVSLRMFLAQQGLRKGDLSKFVEEAVRWRVLDRVVTETKAKNTKVSARALSSAIEEATEAIRADHFNTTAA